MGSTHDAGDLTQGFSAWLLEHGAIARADAARVGSAPGAVKVAVFRLRQRLGHEIRAEVAKTVADPAAIAEEMPYLMAALGA